MNPSSDPTRLLIEVLGILVVTLIVERIAAAALVPPMSVLEAAALDAAALVVLAAPAIYWRCMALLRRSSKPVPVVAPVDISLPTAIAMTATTQFLGLVLTGVGVFWALGHIDTSAQAAFDLASQRIAAEAKQRLDNPMHGIEATAGLYAAGLHFDRAAFRAYVAATPLAKEFPGARGLGFVQRVARDATAGFVAEARAEGDPGFALADPEPGGDGDRLVLRYFEPAPSGPMARGRDLAGLPSVRDPLLAAIDTGEATVSRRLPGGVDRGEPGSLVYGVPIYRPGQGIADPAQRRAALIGLLIAPIAVADLLNGVAESGNPGIAFQLMDGDLQSNPAVVYDSRHEGQGAGLPISDGPAPTRFERRIEIPLGGRSLAVRTFAGPGFASTIDNGSPLMIGLGGIFISLLLAATVWVLAIGRLRAQRRAERMTAELDRLATVARRTSNAVTITDADLRISWINEGFTRMSGYALDHARGRIAAELLSGPDTDPAALARLRDAAAQAQTCRSELRCRRMDGSAFWVELEIQPMRDAAGRVTGYMEIASDISAAKADQQRMSALTDRLTLAIAGGNDGLWDWMDLSTDRQWWSPRLYALLGYSAGDVEPGSRLFDELLHPDSREPARAAVRRALAGGEGLDAEFQLRCADGGYRWFHARAKVQFGPDGRASRMSGSLQDTTERRRAAEALRASERFMRFVTDSIPAVVSYWTPELRCSFANSAYTGWIGMRPDQVIGMALRELVGEQRFVENEPHIQAALRGEEQRVERSRVRLDGSIARYWLHFLPDRDGDSVKGFLSVLIDVTELKNAQLQLESLNTTLVERTAQAEAASVAKSQFLANMSHEIRTPMNAIIGMLTLLRKTELSANQIDYADKARGAARSLLGLLNDILDFSKVEAGKMALDPRPFRMDALLRDLSVILSASCGDKPIELLFDIDPAIPQSRLLGDDMRLRQVLINLGGNAVKFTAEGEVVIRATVVERHDDAVLIEFSVRDSGIGIAPEHQSSIFEGFSQAESSTTRRYGGTGLGLAISRRLVEMMGGTIALTSSTGVGSDFHFRIRFPICAAAEDERKPIADLTGLRVLIVDDNPSAREVLSGMARALGWRADVVASGAEAIRLAGSKSAQPFPYQVVFVDWQMPGMDGWETSQNLRQIADGANAPVVVMVTAHGRELLAQRSAEDQRLLNGFLVKPVTASMLFDAVADARLSLAHPGFGAVRAQYAPRRLDGLRVLVVEDNANNQQVVREMLTDEGALITIAANGREGVAAVAAADPPFDAVLMDLQMPEMDGYEATAEIRGRLGRTDLPIIAMTANAAITDREACLAAGMNDHVGKPFDLDPLVATLLRHSGRQVAADTGLRGSAHADPVPWPADLVDQASALGLDLVSALRRIGGKASIYLSMLGRFAADLPDLLAQASAACGLGQQAEVGRSLHTLKGLAATVGLAALAGQAGAAERRLAQPDMAPAEIRELLADLNERTGGLAASLAQLVDLLAAATAGPAPASLATAADRESLARQMTTLCGLLADSDLRALEVHAQWASGAGALDPDRVKALGDALAGLDFPLALSLAQAWATELNG
jgi:PAS domain S-box-containing protein